MFSWWNQPALVDAFYSGMSDLVKSHLISVDLPIILDASIALRSKIDKRRSECERLGNCPAFKPLPIKPRPIPNPVPEPLSSCS